ncbi:MAG: hypothetical protein ABSG31_14835 [Tepidisphaeraceae bacterium]
MRFDVLDATHERLLETRDGEKFARRGVGLAACDEIKKLSHQPHVFGRNAVDDGLGFFSQFDRAHGGSITE